MSQPLTDVIAEAMWPTLCGEDDLPLTKASSYQQRQARKAAEEALQAIDQAGYVCVRKAPTRYQLDEGAAVLRAVLPGGFYDIAAETYRAMLSASKEGITE